MPTRIWTYTNSSGGTQYITDICAFPSIRFGRYYQGRYPRTVETLVAAGTPVLYSTVANNHVIETPLTEAAATWIRYHAGPPSATSPWTAGTAVNVGYTTAALVAPNGIIAITPSLKEGLPSVTAVTYNDPTVLRYSTTKTTRTVAITNLPGMATTVVDNSSRTNAAGVTGKATIVTSGFGGVAAYRGVATVSASVRSGRASIVITGKSCGN